MPKRKAGTSKLGKARGKGKAVKRSKEVSKEGKGHHVPESTPLEIDSPPINDKHDTHEEKPHRKGTFVKGDPRINRTKAGPGRRTDKFKRWCARMVANPKVQRAVRQVLQNPNAKAQTAMWKAVAAHAHGAPAAHIDMVHKVQLEDLLAASHEREE